MSEKRLELKVGLFVLLGLTVLATLMLNFAKGLSFFKPTYELRMKTGTVGGLKRQAAVLMSGVEVGKVIDAELSQDMKTVTIRLKIYQKYKIYSDAGFAIDALGFLGDQFVAIRPRKNEGHILRDGEEVTAQEPFDLQEVARASLTFINRIDQTAQKLNEAISRVSNIVLNEQTLTNLAISMSNFRKVSERAIQTVDGIDNLFQTNSLSISSSVSNLMQFSEQLNSLADELSETIATNRTEISVAVKNLSSATATTKNLLADLDAGKGVAGALLRDDQLKLEMSSFLTNLNAVSMNLGILSSNINNKGLWSVLWKPKTRNSPRTNQPPAQLHPGKAH